MNRIHHQGALSYPDPVEPRWTVNVWHGAELTASVGEQCADENEARSVSDAYATGEYQDATVIVFDAAGVARWQVVTRAPLLCGMCVDHVGGTPCVREYGHPHDEYVGDGCVAMLSDMGKR